MIVGPRYNDSDPAVEAAYQREAQAETASKLDRIAARLEAATPGRQTSDVHPDDVAALLAVVREVAALHRPHRKHDPISNPDFYYKVCTKCVDVMGDDHLWPCPTATALAPLTEEETDGR